MFTYPMEPFFCCPWGKAELKKLKIHIHTLYIFELSFYNEIRMSAGVGMVTAEIKIQLVAHFQSIISHIVKMA